MEKFLYKRNPKKNADYNIWMAFPGCYSFALSSLGYLHIFRLMDEMEEVNVERVYSDSTKTEIQFKDVNAIAFSSSFDLDFMSIFPMFDKYKIPYKTSDRDKNMPIIFCGGPVVTANPIPYKDFFDFMIIGDGEQLNTNVVTILADNKDKPKDEILKLLAKLNGIYVPTLNQEKIVKNSCKIENCVYTPILSDDAFFKDMFIIEISRGCANCCGFCMASYLNLPVRFAPYENIIEAIDLGLQYTNKIALLGAQVSIHPKFKQICEYIAQKVQKNPEIEMSISSLRVDAVDDAMIKTLVSAHQKHVTIAIEAGSERLRKVINKNITEEQIKHTVETARLNGLKGVKIYAMIGIPTETQEDLNEMVRVAKELKQANKGFDISFAFSSFIPKPHTPLQWCGRFSTKELEKRQNFLQKEFHKIGVKTSFSSIKWDYWQTVLSRGDEKISDFIIDVYKNGSKLGAFKKAAKDKFNPDDYALRDFNLNEALSWDIIDLPPSKEVLIERHKKLLNLP
ncbi:MAG: hypothetical protein DKM23_04945 [Candidatus Melainabacteria bacterium]|nr:MAG: hypothetical protein DKM23_04945 [Candidatus Melainabacteria bacterium]